MTVYARSDVRSVATPAGHVHKPVDKKKAAGENRPRYEVDCPACEPFLLETGLFATHPGLVPATPDELLEDERAKEEGQAGVTEAFKAIAKEAMSQRAAQRQASR